MKEPRRLLSHGATDFERQLLRAVVNERPSAVLRSRMQRGLGLVGPLAWASTVKAMFGGMASKLAAVVLGSALVVGGATAVWLLPGSEPATADSPELAPTVQAAVQAETAPAAPAPAALAEAAPAAEPVAAPLPVVSAASLPTVAEAAAPAEPAAAAELDGSGSDRQLREEIALIDAARSALQAGNRELARERLQVYGERFPEGILRREAKVLSRRAEAKRAKR